MTDPTTPLSLETAYQRCQELASRHYENFPVSSLLLPAPLRPHVAALYAFARVADDIADEESYRGPRLKDLARYEKDFRSALQGKPAPLHLQAFAHTVKTFRISPSLPLSLLKAFRQDVTVHRYSTWKAILDYCAHSANPVGRIVLMIFGSRDPRLFAWSDRICSGLQLINFWQDTALDLSRDRVYYPKNEWRKAGVTEQEVLSGSWSPRYRNLVLTAVEFTEQYFRGGYPIVENAPPALRVELKATFLGGMAILRKIRQKDYNVLERRPALGTWDKISLTLNALFGKIQP